MPWPVGFNPFRTKKIADELLEKRNKRLGISNGNTEESKPSGLEKEDEELIARLRSPPLMADADVGGRFFFEHLTKTKEVIDGYKQNPADLKALYEYIARKSSYKLTPKKASEFASTVVKEFLTGRRTVEMNLLDIKLANKLEAKIGPLKPGAVSRNSIECILRNVPDFEKHLLSGYESYIRALKK